MRQKGVILIESVVFIALTLSLFTVMTSVVKIVNAEFFAAEEARRGAVNLENPFWEDSDIVTTIIDMLSGEVSEDEYVETMTNVALGGASLISNTKKGRSIHQVNLDPTLTGYTMVTVKKKYYCVNNTWSARATSQALIGDLKTIFTPKPPPTDNSAWDVYEDNKYLTR